MSIIDNHLGKIKRVDNICKTFKGEYIGRILDSIHAGVRTVGHMRSRHQEVSTLDKYSFGSFSWLGAFDAFDCEAIEICGVCTDICVISNALILRSMFNNKRIICHKDWCAGTSPAAHEAALEVMESCQIEVV